MAPTSAMCERHVAAAAPCGPEGLMDAERKARLGTRWNCSECGVVFYDLGKADAVCPKCDTKQLIQVPAKKKSAGRKAAGNYRRPLRQPAEVPVEEEDASTEPLEDDGLVDEDDP